MTELPPAIGEALLGALGAAFILFSLWVVVGNIAHGNRCCCDRKGK